MKTKQSVDFHSLGDKHKAIEKISAGQRLVPGVPVMARLDGRAFHTLLAHAKKPFDEAVVTAMQETAKKLLDQFHADVAYTQSDEITLVWSNLDMFDGKIQKMVSTLSASASVTFSLKYGSIGCFDCRVWQIANLDLAAENIMWRELDATKNSISMTASAHFSDKELHGKNSNERLQMLEGKDVHWAKLPHYLKKGSYFHKIEIYTNLDEEELAAIPEKHRPVGPVRRSKIVMMNIPPATTISNLADVLFYEVEPIPFKTLGESKDVVV